MLAASKQTTLHFQKLSQQQDDLNKKLLKQQKRVAEYDTAIAEALEAINQLRIAKRNQGGAQADRELVKRTDKEVNAMRRWLRLSRSWRAARPFHALLVCWLCRYSCWSKRSSGCCWRRTSWTIPCAAIARRSTTDAWTAWRATVRLTSFALI